MFYRNPSELGLEGEDRLALDTSHEEAKRKITWAEWGALFAHRTTWG